MNSQHSLAKFDVPINSTAYDEISPVLSYGEKILFFTRIGSPDFDKTLFVESIDLYSTYSEEEYETFLHKVFSQITSGQVEDVTSSDFNQDIWVVYLDSLGKPLDLAHPGHPLNNALPNSICSRFDDHHRFILINRFEREGGLDTGFSVSQMKKDSFTFPEPLYIENFALKSLQVNITSSRDQKTLILAMPTPDGNMDLYVSKRLFDQHYSQPIPIQKGVNTEFNEVTPFLSDDGQTLFFASNRPESIGGTDIFSVSRVDDTYLEWKDLASYLPPLNSPLDEMYPILNKNGTRCIFSSNRDGSFDIFQTKLNRDKNLRIIVDVILLNGESGLKMPCELYWENTYNTGVQISNFFRVRDGKHRLYFEENIPMKIRAENRNWKSRTILIDPQEIHEDSLGKMSITLTLWPDKSEEMQVPMPRLLEIPLEYVLDASKENQAFSSAMFQNIQFEKSTARLLNQSMPVIHSLGKYLLAKQDISIKITGHTDNVGNKNDLLALSRERAQTIKKLLVNLGVAEGRIETEGAGCDDPITDNSTEAKRKLNRRVEIKIMDKPLLP